MLYYVIVIEKIYSLSLSIQYHQKFKYYQNACAFPSKDYVITPGTGLHFEIPRQLAPGLKKPEVNIKEILRNAGIKFSFFCEISYFLSIFVIMMILSNAKIPNTIMKLLLIRKLLINTKIIFLFHQSSYLL